MGGKVPFLLVFVTQLASVIGDATGQRCSRVYHHGNRNRFLVSMVVVTAVQMCIGLLIVQYGLPETATVLHKKINGTSLDVCSLNTTSPHYPGAENCFAQGPGTIFKSIQLCPMLLVDGLLNIVYYYGEATMYREPLGVMLLVMCALTSTFVVSPMQGWLGMKQSEGSNAPGIIFGMAGALLCTLERRAPSNKEKVETEDGTPTPEVPVSPTLEPPTLFGRCRKALAYFPILVPFALLSFAYALYFVMMQYYDEKCDVNAWGYNALDQVGLPVYMFPAIFVSTLFMHCAGDKASGGSRVPASESGHLQRVTPTSPGTEEMELITASGPDAGTYADPVTFVAIVKLSFRENMANYGQGFFFMFVYRFFVNGRAISYYFIASEYDLSEAYLVLTLVRVLLSWIVSLALVLVVPRFIVAAGEEKRQLLDRVNLTCKCVGSVCVVLSLLFINGNI